VGAKLVKIQEKPPRELGFVGKLKRTDEPPKPNLDKLRNFAKMDLARKRTDAED
jgi:hypothetical protein